MFDVLVNEFGAIFHHWAMSRVNSCELGFQLIRELQQRAKTRHICSQVLKNGSTLSEDCVRGKQSLLFMEKEAYRVAGVTRGVQDLERAIACMYCL